MPSGTTLKDPVGALVGARSHSWRVQGCRRTLVPLFENHVRTTRVASKRGLAGTVLVVLVVQPPVEHGMVLAQSKQTILMEMISVLQVIDMIIWYYRGPEIAVAAQVAVR